MLGLSHDEKEKRGKEEINNGSINKSDWRRSNGRRQLLGLRNWVGMIGIARAGGFVDGVGLLKNLADDD